MNRLSYEQRKIAQQFIEVTKVGVSHLRSSSYPLVQR